MRHCHRWSVHQPCITLPPLGGMAASRIFPAAISQCKPRRKNRGSAKFNYSVDQLSKKLNEQFPNLNNLNWVATRLLEGDQSIIQAIRTGALGNLSNEGMEMQMK